MSCTHVILFVADLRRASAFYRALFGRPRLDVPGMVELVLPDGAVLGLMPRTGFERLLGEAVAGPVSGHRSELYLLVEEPDGLWARAIEAGATVVSPLAQRDWGHRAGYLRDPEGNLLAIAGEEPAAM